MKSVEKEYRRIVSEVWKGTFGWRRFITLAWWKFKLISPQETQETKPFSASRLVINAYKNKVNHSNWVVIDPVKETSLDNEMAEDAEFNNQLKASQEIGNMAFLKTETTDD